MNQSSGNGSVPTLLQQYQTLLAVSQAIASHRDLRELLQILGERLQEVVRFDELFVDLHDETDNTMRLHLLSSSGPASALPGTSFPTEQLPSGWVWQSQQPLVLADLRDETRWPLFLKQVLHKVGIRSTCVLPLTTARRRLGTMGLGSRAPSAYDAADVSFLQQVANQVAVAVENVLAYQHIEELNGKLHQEKVYLEEEIRTQHNFDAIVGASAALRQVLKDVETVAPTDSTVLIQGETGTGKELVARAVHMLSGRRARTFVKVNCAAIPTGLLESELFGHERGAFTGAIAQKVGRFELADQGTLFLDEIGDISPELQPKLLRVLQDQEFERLGSTQTQRVNVRLMAATNRDLGEMVAEGTFRSDLFYRLHVFPLTLPPLRERREDIPELVRHFVKRFAGRMGKRIETIPQGALSALTEYAWPGNVRELENFIERAVILSSGTELHVPIGELMALPGSNGFSTSSSTLVAAERAHILRMLRQTNWVLGGSAGAAARLGMKRSTLQWKMKKLCIARPA